MKEIFRRQNSAPRFHQVSPASLLYVCAGNCQRALLDISGMIRNHMGKHDRSEMVVVQGSPCAPTHKDKHKDKLSKLVS
jgi:hypothetical protein